MQYTYKGTIDIDTKTWFGLISDNRVFEKSDLKIMQELLRSENCTERAGILAEKLGYATAGVVNRQIGQLGKRVKNKLPTVKFPVNDRGEFSAWRTFFYGYERKENEKIYFYWELRPELAKALNHFFRKPAFFLNGVYASVLEEIVRSQRQGQEENILQPYSQEAIKMLQNFPPCRQNPVQLYLSTTDNLNEISYQAEIIGWYEKDKDKLSAQQQQEFNNHVKQYQPDEGEIYFEREYKGKKIRCKNLLRIRDLAKIPTFPISELVKVSNKEPLQNRTQAGGWSEVYRVKPVDKKEFDEKENLELEQAKQRSSQERLDRIAAADKKAAKVTVISQVYRRNKDVAAEVKSRANGICGLCHAPAPFEKPDGEPFLEVHHWISIAENGNDTLENTVALCPNCHRRAHSGKDKDYIAKYHKLQG